MSVWTNQEQNRAVAPGSWHLAIGCQSRPSGFVFTRNALGQWLPRVPHELLGSEDSDSRHRTACWSAPAPPSHTHTRAHRQALAS